MRYSNMRVLVMLADERGWQGENVFAYAVCLEIFLINEFSCGDVRVTINKLLTDDGKH